MIASRRALPGFWRPWRRLLSTAWPVLLLTSTAFAEPIPVELRETDQGWQLLRGGEPYFIRGAGGTGSLEQLAAAGANSVRTWGADELDDLLDQAHALGLSVTIGIWLGHERHGFDYGDQTQVREQLENARRYVLRYRDHPALLLWGIGNEMEGFEDGDDPAIWAAVNDIAAMVKALDPAHPTMTVTAEIGGARIENVHAACPDIDIHGINSYGGALSLGDRLQDAGATKPYVLTEFGPPGTWETASTAWDAPYEMTSTDKAAFYRRSYTEAVLKAPGRALGSYVFNWGYKMEATATWYGMFLPDGSRLAAIDVMQELWSGEQPADLAPTVRPLVLDGDARFDPGKKLRVPAVIADPEGGALRVSWALRRESGDYAAGGDFRPMLPDLDDAVLEADQDSALLRLPKEPGPYRLFVYAYDEAGNAATANAPLFVKGQVRAPMPFYVYDDGLEGMPWAPSGWMGATDALSLDGAHEDEPYAGSASIRMRYAGEFGWVGVAWQHPVNNWGEQDGGYDLSGARFLELWARGEYGGERVGFGVGLLGEDVPYPDSAVTSIDDVVLTTEWRRYRIPVKRLDLSSIKTGFVVTISGRASPVTVFLDEIRYVR